jgi:uncharacterized membrane-anchored protein
MKLMEALSKVVPTCFKRSAEVRRRLREATHRNQEVVHEATTEIHQLRLTMNRATILADMRAIDERFKRRDGG